MKNSILYTSIFLLTVTMLSSCQTSAKKNENAESEVKEAKKDLANSKEYLYQVRLDTISNYEQFKIEAEKIIIAREKNIAEFKAGIASEKREMNAGYDKKLLALENKNKELKKKLANLKDDGHDKWIDFKNEFNHDISEFGTAFKDLTVNNEN